MKTPMKRLTALGSTLVAVAGLSIVMPQAAEVASAAPATSTGDKPERTTANAAKSPDVPASVVINADPASARFIKPVPLDRPVPSGAMLRFGRSRVFPPSAATPIRPVIYPSSTRAITLPGTRGDITPSSSEGVGRACPVKRPLAGASVRFPGPSGIVMAGRITCTAGGNFTVNVLGGSGTVGGMTLAARDFYGSVRSRGGVVTGLVTVRMPNHSKVIPQWNQNAKLQLSFEHHSWSGKVLLGQSRKTSSMTMSGPLLPDGSYALKARGSLTFAGKNVAITGEYLSRGYPTFNKSTHHARPASRPVWHITGARHQGVIAGVPVTEITIDMHESTPGVTGSAALNMPNAIDVRSVITYVDEVNWTLTALSSTTPTWSPSQIPGLSVRGASMTGAVVSHDGRIRWAQAAPMTIVDEKLVMGGTFVFSGPARWNLHMGTATGSILGAPGDVPFTRVDGNVTIDAGTVSGSVAIEAAGALLAGLPQGWTPSTSMRVTFAKARGQVAVVRRSVAYTMSNQGSHITLSANAMSSEAFKLTASGSVKVGSGSIPFGGTYESAGYVSNGVARTAPYYSMYGSVANAAGGKVPLGSGMSMKGGSIGFGGGQMAPAPRTVPSLYITATQQAGWNPWGAQSRISARSGSTTTISGSVDVALSEDSSFTLGCTLEYSDENNWLLTVASTDGDPWSPFSGLTIQTSSFHGTVQSVDADLIWNVTIDAVEWTNVSTGVNIHTGFSVSDECPLTEHCPGLSDVIYVGFTNGNMHFPSPTLDLSLDGAFTTDAQWARFDASAGDVTYNGITVSGTDLAVWLGAKDGADPNLDMPDLSASNNGFGIEFCGTMHVDVPNVSTVTTDGCVTWSPDGVVMGQVGMGGDVATGESDGGVTVDGTTLAGFAWTNLGTQPVVSLNGADLTLEANINYMTATIDIPAEDMQAFGAGNDPATVTANGWFSSDAFSLDADIAVALTNSGFTLDSIGVHIGKDGDGFALSFGANATVTVSGNHYPVSAVIGYTGNPPELKVTLDVRGGVKDQTATAFDGLFDTATLLPSGDFEPVTQSLVDGSFDAKADKGVLSDGTFEAADSTGNLVTNPDFESGVQPQLMPNGDFESGDNGNLLDNANAEDSNTLLNGDLENGTTSWELASGFTMTATSPADNAPSTEVGQASYTLRNGNGATSNTGLSQTIPMAPVLNAAYTFNAWVKSPDTSTGRVVLYVDQTGTAVGCSTQSTSTTTSPAYTVNGSWIQISLPVTGTSCRTGFKVKVDAIDGGDSVTVDSMTFTLDSSPSVALIPNTNRPALQDRFDDMPPIQKSSGVYQTASYGHSLRSPGCSSNWWYYNTGTYGYASGDFDMSINVLHPRGNGKRDMGSIAFWMNGSGTGATGYSLRTQTQNGDGGFWQVGGSGGSKALNSNGNYLPDFATDVWYQVRITATGNYVTGRVTRLDTGEQVWTSTVNVGTNNVHSGTYGLVADSQCSSEGTVFDEFAVYQGTTNHVVKYDPANAHSGDQYVAMTGSTNNWDAQYMTGEQPTAGTTYSYSAWVRSRGANVSGALFIDTPSSDSTYESNSVGFTATNQWQLVTVSLKIVNAGHSDIRPGFLDMSSPNIEIDVDDQIFSVAPWVSSPSPTSASQIVTTDAHAGTGALSFQDRVNGSTLYYDLAGWPAVGATYTATAWVKSATAIDASFNLTALGGTQEVASTSFTTTNGWTQYTAQLTTNGYGHTNLRAAIEIKPGHQYETLIIDDVSVIATGQQSDHDGSVSDLPAPTGWTNTGGEVKWINGASGAHADMGYMAITPSGSYTKDTSFAVTTSPKVGSTYTATAWVKGSGCGNGYLNGQITLSSGLESATASYVANPTYQQVTATLPITKSGATALTMKIANTQNSNSCYLLFDDVGIQLIGLGLNDPWQAYDQNGYISMTVLNDPSKAHEGSNFLEVKATNGSGYMYIDSSFQPAVGTSQTMSIWVRSPNGQPFYGALGLISYGGSTNTDDESRFLNFTTSGTAWQQVFVTLPITSSANTLLRTEINIDSVGVAGDIDQIVSSALPIWSPWEPTGTTVNEMIVPDQSGAAEGSSYLTIQTTGSNGGGVIATASENVHAGAVYTMSMYVRSTTGAFVDGQFGLAFNGNSSEANYKYFTANSEWQKVTMSFTATRSNSFVQPLVDVFGSNGVRLLDIDSITVTPQIIVSDDPWSVRGDVNPTATATMYDDATRAHDGSYGYLQVYKTGNGDGETYKDTSVNFAVGETYSASVWVRSSTGTPVNGRYMLFAQGGTEEYATVDFTATNVWTLVSVRLPIYNSGHNTMRVNLVWYESNVVLDVDDAQAQKVVWLSANSSTTQQKLIMDGASAQSGSGYLHIDYSGTGDGVVYQDSPFTPDGSDYTMTAWVRSPTGATVSGKLYVQAYGGAGKDGTALFTISGTDWHKVTVTLPNPIGNTMLRTHVVDTTSGVPFDVDSVGFTKSGVPAPDGVSDMLPHPQSGYAYLWDDAFGIPGAHLWDITAQVEVYDVYPYFGLGVGATMYFDPSKMSGVMQGTDWLKGSMSVNLSSIDPCFSFGFDGAGTNARIAIDGGVFSTQTFTMSFAPKGCQIGSYVVPQGISLGLDTYLGDSLIHLDLEVGKDDNNRATFHGDAALHDIMLAGTTYNTMELTLDINSDVHDISFVGDFTLPMGSFYGDFDLSLNVDKLHMSGDVSVSDWKLVGGTMDVSSFNFTMVMDIPFGSGACANINSDIGGKMSMGSKTNYDFSGNLGIECGRLKTLHMQFAYMHRSVTYEFMLDYKSSNHTLSGGFSFTFERSTSWKFLGHRYSRHPKIALAMYISMDITKPASTINATLGGTISVSGGSGSMQCTLSSSSDDECKIEVDINKYGGHHFSDTW